MALSFLTLNAACTTYKLYNPNATFHTGEGAPYPYLEDQIGAFLITQDNKQLIVIGENYHYFFPANDETLKFALTWAEKKRIKASFGEFVVEESQKVSGVYTLSVKDDFTLTPDTQKLLQSKGFKVGKNQPTELVYERKIQGQRYSAEKFKLPKTIQQLNEKYTVKIYENYLSNSELAKRVLLTPLMVAADGAFVVLGVAAIPLGMVMVPFMQLKNWMQD